MKTHGIKPVILIDASLVEIVLSSKPVFLEKVCSVDQNSVLPAIEPCIHPKSGVLILQDIRRNYVMLKNADAR
jgi:hypothetical protein